MQPNALVIRIQPDEGIKLLFTTMVPGREDEIKLADMDFRYATSGMQPSEAYERVLLDALRGRPTLFWRADSVEAAWRAVAPLLKPLRKEIAQSFPNYEPGSWGPKEAEELLTRDGRFWFMESSQPTL
jgi:glucose-6-phosphate 1-dehydrogenase